MSESPRTHTAFEAACNSGSGTRAMGHMLIHGMKLEHELAASQAETKRALSQLDDAVTRLQQQNERVAELERIEPDLFWDADDPENTGSETLDWGARGTQSALEFVCQCGEDYLVDKLRVEDNRWGYNGKRGNVNDPSQDVVDYHYGAGPSDGSTSNHSAFLSKPAAKPIGFAKSMPNWRTFKRSSLTARQLVNNERPGGMRPTRAKDFIASK